jgi:hypothetical protein
VLFPPRLQRLSIYRRLHPYPSGVSVALVVYQLEKLLFWGLILAGSGFQSLPFANLVVHPIFYSSLEIDTKQKKENKKKKKNGTGVPR